ncbi:MAG: hypothetical protein M3430_04855, partial [Acidobacteriota bacterium]|nr:hypothetical protein [Acidobacteriota bacterium]
LIDTSLSGAITDNTTAKSGYIYQMEMDTSNAGYLLSIAPKVDSGVTATGNNQFETDQSGVLFQNAQATGLKTTYAAATGTVVGN